MELLQIVLLQPRDDPSKDLFEKSSCGAKPSEKGSRTAASGEPLVLDKTYEQH